MHIEPSTFSDFMEKALYGETGFYTTGGGAGRSRDYLTSPEVGDLFGKVIASYIDDWYENLETDQPAIVIDAGCGPGSLAVSIARANLKCAQNIKYVLVDRSPSHLKECERKLVQTNAGFAFSTSSDLPQCTLPTLIVANELLDNLVFDIETVHKDSKTFSTPVHVGIDTWLDELVEATAKSKTVDLLLFDYMKELDDFEDGNWLRLYCRNKRIVGIDKVLSALENGLTGDITTDVIKQKLEAMVEAHGFSHIDLKVQSQWLTDHGIDSFCGTNQFQSGYEKFASFINSKDNSNDFSKERHILIDAAGLGSFSVLTAKRMNN